MLVPPTTVFGVTNFRKSPVDPAGRIHTEYVMPDCGVPRSDAGSHSTTSDWNETALVARHPANSGGVVSGPVLPPTSWWFPSAFPASSTARARKRNVVAGAGSPF